jgi:hypothetical protein
MPINLVAGAASEMAKATLMVSAGSGMSVPRSTLQYWGKKPMKAICVVALVLLMVTGCAPRISAPPPTTAPAATPAPAPAPAQISSGVWDVEHVRCSDLLGAADDDRAAAAMFYYGYLAAKAGIRVIDVNIVDGNIAKVMSQCAAQPDITVPQAFRRALKRNR